MENIDISNIFGALIYQNKKEIQQKAHHILMNKGLKTELKSKQITVTSPRMN